MSLHNLAQEIVDDLALSIKLNLIHQRARALN